MKTNYLEKFIDLNVELRNEFKLFYANNNNKFGAKLEDINKCI